MADNDNQADDFPLGTDGVVPQFEVDKARVAAARAADERSITGTDVFNAFRDNSYTGMLIESGLDAIALRDAGIEADPDYIMSQEMFDSVTEGLPEDTWGQFGTATSDEHALVIRNHVLDYVDRRKSGAELGYAGIALDVVAGLLDPLALAADAASLGATKLLTGGKTLSRVGQAVADGLAVGVTNAGLEATVGQVRADHTDTDILWAAGIGLTLGGGIGALRGGVSHGALEAKLGTQLMRASELEDAKRAGLTITDKGEAYASIGGKKRLAETLTDTDQDLIDALDDSAGAQRNPFQSAPLSSEAEEAARIAEGEGIAAPFKGRGRIDMTGQLVASKNPLMRRLGVNLAEDAVGLVGRDTPIGASEEAMRGWRTTMAEYHRSSNPNFRKWLADYNGAKLTKTRLTNIGKEREFQKLVTEAVLNLANPAALVRFHPAVVDTARTMARLQEDILNVGKRAGITNFDNIPANVSYVTRLANRDAIEAAVKRYGTVQLERALANAIIRGSDDITAESAAKIAKSWLKTHRGLRVGARDAMRSTVRGAQDLRDMLVDTLVHEKNIDAAVARDEVDAMVAFRQDKGDGAMARAKRRVQMDELYGEELLDSTTQTPELFSLSSLFERDAQRLLSLYARQVHGHAAMAKRGFPDEGAFKAELDRARKAATDFGQDPGKLEDEVEIAETLYKSIVGRPLADYSKGHNKWARRVMDFQYIRVMGQVGWAQIPEMAVLMGQVGIRTALDQLPAFKAFVTRSLKDGKIPDETQQELETIWGFGTDSLRAHFGGRIDDFGEFDAPRTGSIDTVLDFGKNVTTHISAFNMINQVSHRWANRAIVAKFAQAAFDKTKISTKRLRTLGMEPELAERVYGQIRAHSVTGEGFLTGRKMHQINIDDWQDREAADAFVNGVDRWVRRAIQNNDVGNMSMWMTKPMLQIISQFRSFMLVAYTKQLMHGLNMRDFQTGMSFVLSNVFAGMSYTAQTVARAQLREDKDQYLKERLTVGNIAAASFQRAGWATFFPAFYDLAAKRAGLEPVFQHGRTTGLPSNALLGNPSVDFGNKLLTTGTSDTFTQGDLYSITQMFPFANALIIQNLLKKWTQSTDLPENRG